VIIDAHCHVWPDQIASQVLAQRPAGLDPVADGTLGGLARALDSAGIDMAVCLAVASAPRHVARANEFIGGVDRTRFIPFGTVHPGLPAEDNLRLLRDNGIRGVKLHPLFQQLSLADPRVIDLLAALAEAGIVVITHAGSGGGAEANERGAPRHLRAVIDALPDLNLIACHFGGYHRIEEAEQLVVGSPVVLETSWPPSLADLDAARVSSIITRHGTDRVVYGSDWPMTSQAAEVAAIRALGLSAADEEGVLGGNLSRLLGL
jgi:predicted TIM-barrel fold metal-dependent hydrolase